MKRLNLTVEGQTEQGFAVSVLQPHLAQFNVFVTKPRLTGLVPRRRGQIPGGGLVRTFNHSLEDIRRWLLEDRSAEARFSIMVDFYSLPRDFPGWARADQFQDAVSKVNALQDALASELGDHRFIPYVQLHEFEALLLSAPGRFKDFFEEEARVLALAQETRRFASPEQIDDGSTTHPKARIQKHLPDYRESTDGPTLAEAIGLSVIRERCPHFDQWLTLLENLDDN